MVNKFMLHNTINYHSWQVTAISHNVEIMCKTTWKSSCKFRANFCGKLLLIKNTVHKNIYSPTFPTHSTDFFTAIKQIASTIFSTIPHTLLLQLQNILIIKHSERIV